MPYLARKVLERFLIRLTRKERGFQALCECRDLVVHPLSCCGIWHDGDPGAARGAVPPSAAPDEGMLVRVPVRGGTLDGFFDLGPGFEAAPFEGQRAQDLPPRLSGASGK